MRLKCGKVSTSIGYFLCQLYSINVASRSLDVAMDTCMSDLCTGEQAFLRDICDAADETYQTIGSKVCNMTIHSILDHFPSLQGCMCAWEEEPCSSLQLLAAQCHHKPAQQKRGIKGDWKSSSLTDYVYDPGESCIKQMTVCIHDEICNMHLVPLVQACSSRQCNNTQCQQASHQFYNGLPRSVAEMLFLCECDPGDLDCLHIKSTLHSGTCEEEPWSCLEGLTNCLAEGTCRKRLKNLLTNCWTAEESPCIDSTAECISILDPTMILALDFECRSALLATIGTALQHPCTCTGLHDEDQLKCNVLLNILHNRSHFMYPSNKNRASLDPLELNKSERGHQWLSDQLLYVFVNVLLIVVILLTIFIIFLRLRIHKRTEKTKFHHPDKSCVVIF